MALASKHYYLFSIRVWSVVVETEAEDVEVEDEEIDPGVSHLSASMTLSADDVPMIGFTPWTPHWVTEEEE